MYVMGIRERMNQSKNIGIGVAVVLVVGAIGLAFWTSGESRPSGFRVGYYSLDEGKTYFEDKAGQLVPFTKDGKEAVRAYVFSCDNGKTKFVGYLEKLSANARAEAEKYKSAGSMPDTPTAQRIFEGGAMIKKPGGEWGSRDSFGPNGPVTKCPDGSFAMPVVADAPRE
jgi:hypothetical protein